MSIPSIDAIAYEVMPNASWEQIRDELLRMAGSRVYVDVQTQSGTEVLSLLCMLREPDVLTRGSDQCLCFSIGDGPASRVSISQDVFEEGETTVGYVSVVLGTLRVSISRWTPKIS